MKNKSRITNQISILVVLISCLFIYGFFAIARSEPTIIGVSSQSLKNNFSTIHFNAGGNDFWGGTLWISTQKKLDAPITITTNEDSRECLIKLEGLYFNSQRGERLWPLDENTLNSLKKWGTDYDDLSVFWGLYTHCKKANETEVTETGDLYSIYGVVEHRVRTNTSYFLAAGVNYDLPNNRIEKNSKMHCSLQLVNNKTAVGYLYDYQGGIGFVGGNVPSTDMNEHLSQLLNQGQCITDIFSKKDENTLEATIGGKLRTIDDQNSLQNLKRWLAIRGIVGFTNDLFLQDHMNVEGNFGSKSQTVRTTSVSLADAVNVSRKKAEQLCRNLWNKDQGTIRCFDSAIWTIKSLTLEPGVTYIFKGIDAELNSYMNTADNTSKPVTVFIDGGNLLIPNSISTGELASFNDAGYPDIWNAVNQGNFLKGNFIINGLVAPSAGTSIENKLYVHGKLLSLNTYDVPSEGRIKQIRTLLWDTIDEKLVNFRTLFTRRCENPVVGEANDGTSCQKGESEFSRAPLSIIDMDFPSLLWS